MTVFLTGATGFIGYELLRQLTGEGRTVHLLHRPGSERKIDTEDPRIRLFRGDIRDPGSLEAAMEGCTRAYHLAGYARPWAPDPATYHRVNVEGTRNVLEAALGLGLERAVVTSSGATLPGASGGRPADESDEKKQFETLYGRTKYLAEEEARTFARRGLHTVIVNPPRVYGPGLMTESNAVTRLIKWYMEGKWRFLPGDGRHAGNYVFVGDVARGHRLAMERGRPGERYILGGENISLAGLFRMVGRLSGKERTMWNVPLPLVRLLARVEEWKADTFNRPPLITPAWVDNYLKDASLTSAKAVDELGYTITPLEEGLEKTIRWLRKKS